jgi:hypothetical protein
MKMYTNKNIMKVCYKMNKKTCPMFDNYKPVINKWECLLYCPIITTRNFVRILFTDIKNKYVNKKIEL